MKLWSKEALSLGGIYCVLDTSFLFLQTPITENIGLILFSIFIICMFLLYWPKFSLYIENQIKKFPNISYYLISIGWIPYFVIIGIVCFIGIAAAFAWGEDTIEKVANIFNAICIWGVPVSLSIAYLRARIIK